MRRKQPISDAPFRSAVRSGAGSYELIEMLGRGGMASVFLAAQARPWLAERLVVLKQPHPTSEDDGGFSARRLRKEAMLSERIDHPHVVRLLDLIDGSRPMMVLEYVEGVSLHDVLSIAPASHAVPLPIAFRMVHDLLAGLQAAHDAADPEGTPLGIVHGDVAPNNVLVGVGGRTRLTDFGLAHTQVERAKGRASKLQGTVRYFAPEQARGKPVDQRADLFSVGILLFELVTNVRLYQGSSSSEVLRHARQGPWRAPVELEKLPPGLRDVCARGLADPVEARYPTASAFAEELNAAATATAGIATHEAAGLWVAERFGPRLERQRQRIAEWRKGSAPAMDLHRLG